MRLEKLLTPFTKNFGRLWDLSKHPFETSGFEILDTFAKLLEQDESLQEPFSAGKAAHKRCLKKSCGIKSS